MFLMLGLITLIAAVSAVSLYLDVTKPTPPQYQTVNDMTIGAIVFVPTDNTSLAAAKMLRGGIVDNTILYPKNGVWEQLPIIPSTGTLVETLMTRKRPQVRAVDQQLSFNCSTADVDSLKDFISWLREERVSAYTIAADGTVRRLDHLLWADFRDRSLVFQATASDTAVVLKTFHYNLISEGSHTFYNSYNGSYYNGGFRGIGYWMLG